MSLGALQLELTIVRNGYVTGSAASEETATTNSQPPYDSCSMPIVWQY